MRRIVFAALTIFTLPSICNAEPVYLHCAHGNDNGADEVTVNEQTGTVSIDGGSSGLIGGISAVFRPTYVRFQIGGTFRRIDRVSLSYSSEGGAGTKSGRCTILKPPPRKF